jgi:hypothetical protein
MSRCNRRAETIARDAAGWGSVTNVSEEGRGLRIWVYGLGFRV